MRSLPLITLSAVLLVSCAVEEKKAVRTDGPEKTLTAISTAFGPYFLPEDPSISSISINYYTAEPEETVVRFSMVGDIDWIRYHRIITRAHRMVFEGLEESAVYEFKVKTGSEAVRRYSSIKTLPYGDSYEFYFAVASADGSNRIEMAKKPHFMVLLSGRNSMDAASYGDFCRHNGDLLASTVVIPGFDFAIEGLEFRPISKGLNCLRYKNVNLVVVTPELSDLGLVGRSLSSAADDKNYIFLNGESRALASNVSRLYSSSVDGIFSCLDTGQENVVCAGTPRLVRVLKTDKYSFKKGSF